MATSYITITSLFLASLTLSGCATTIITKAEMSDAKIDAIKCEPIALTVYLRDQMPPRDDTSVEVIYRPDPLLREQVMAERRQAGCTEEVEIRDIKAERIDFKSVPYRSETVPVMNIVPSSVDVVITTPRKTADSQFQEYLNATYPKNTKKWIQMGFRRNVGPHGPEPYAYILHFLSLGLIPIPDNEDYDLEIRVIGPNQKSQFHEVNFDTRVWTWSPFIFRSDRKTLVGAEQELRIAPVRRVFRSVAE